MTDNIYSEDRFYIEREKSYPSNIEIFIIRDRYTDEFTINTETLEKAEIIIKTIKQNSRF